MSTVTILGTGPGWVTLANFGDKEEILDGWGLRATTGIYPISKVILVPGACIRIDGDEDLGATELCLVDRNREDIVKTPEPHPGAVPPVVYGLDKRLVVDADEFEDLPNAGVGVLCVVGNICTIANFSPCPLSLDRWTLAGVLLEGPLGTGEAARFQVDPVRDGNSCVLELINDENELVDSVLYETKGDRSTIIFDLDHRIAARERDIEMDKSQEQENTKHLHERIDSTEYMTPSSTGDLQTTNLDSSFSQYKEPHVNEVIGEEINSLPSDGSNIRFDEKDDTKSFSEESYTTESEPYSSTPSSTINEQPGQTSTSSPLEMEKFSGDKHIKSEGPVRESSRTIGEKYNPRPLLVSNRDDAASWIKSLGRDEFSQSQFEIKPEIAPVRKFADSWIKQESQNNIAQSTEDSNHDEISSSHENMNKIESGARQIQTFYDGDESSAIEEGSGDYYHEDMNEIESGARQVQTFYDGDESNAIEDEGSGDHYHKDMNEIESGARQVQTFYDRDESKAVYQEDCDDEFTSDAVKVGTFYDKEQEQEKWTGRSEEKGTFYSVDENEIVSDARKVDSFYGDQQHGFDEDGNLIPGSKQVETFHTKDDQDNDDHEIYGDARKVETFYNQDEVIEHTDDDDGNDDHIYKDARPVETFYDASYKRNEYEGDDDDDSDIILEDNDRDAHCAEKRSELESTTRREFIAPEDAITEEQDVGRKSVSDRIAQWNR